MSSPVTDQHEEGIQDAVRRVSEHAVALGRLEAELAKAELARKGRLLGAAAGLGAGAGVLLVLALAFALVAGAVALDLVLPLWGALLIVAGAVLIAGAALGVAALVTARHASPPVPRTAIDEAQATRTALTASNGR